MQYKMYTHIGEQNKRYKRTHSTYSRPV